MPNKPSAAPTSPHFTMLGRRLKGVPEAALGLYVAHQHWPCPCTWSTTDHSNPIVVVGGDFSAPVPWLS